MSGPSPSLRHWLMAAAIIGILFAGMPIFTALV